VTVEPDKCYFHADDSGRILHIGANEVRLLKLQQSEDKNSSQCSLVEQISIRASNQAATQQNKTMKFSSSGRAIRKTYTEDHDVDLSYQCIQSVDHENELDLLVVNIATQSPDQESFLGSVCFHDNYTGTMLKEVQFEEVWNEFCDHVVAVDLDTIIHIAKDPYRKFICYVYRLHLPLDESDRRPKVTSSSKRNKRTVRRQLDPNRGSRRRQRAPPPEIEDEECLADTEICRNTSNLQSHRSSGRAARVNYMENESDEDDFS
jgi:hypothetical protein